MTGQLWEVVGGVDTGGIVVREGVDLKSVQVGDRLATGSTVKEVELVGERLSFQRLDGAGPRRGWVSLNIKGKALLVRSDKKLEAPPVLACFYSGGVTPQQGAKVLEPWLAEAEAAGLADAVVLDHPSDAACSSRRDYIAQLVEKLDEDAGRRSRPVVVVAHSHGCLGGLALAQGLGARCRKLYLLGRRSPEGALGDEVFGVDTGAGLRSLGDEAIINSLVEAWPNDFLKKYGAIRPLPAAVQKTAELVREQYGICWHPVGSAEVSAVNSDALSVAAPILAIAASGEQPKGETPDKVAGWKAYTSGGFELQIVDTDHMGLMKVNSPAFPVLLEDLQTVVNIIAEPGDG